MNLNRGPQARLFKETTMDMATHTNFGADKIKRYGWTVKDKPGKIMSLPKSMLRIDHSYQRTNLSTERIRRISSQWSWVALGAIIVGHRNGQYYVIDGQHRVRAALSRSDVIHLPCLVFETEDVSQEASGFLSANQHRGPITSIVKHRAAVVAQEPIAMIVQKACDDFGLRIKEGVTSAGYIRSVAWAHRRAAEDEETFRLVLGLAADLCAKDNITLHQRLLDGLWVIHAKIGLDDKRLTDRLREKGAKVLIEAANRAAAYYVSGGAKVWAEGMLSEINKGLRNKFALDGSEA